MISDYRHELNANIADTINTALQLSIANPAFARNLFRFRGHLMEANRRRALNEKNGIMVPPFLIVSITHACNLRCEGCYAKELHPVKGKELSTEEWINVFKQAEALGVAFVVMLGGEPFARKDLFAIFEQFPSLMFLVFTNGTLLDEQAVTRIKHLRNVIPLLSVEGHERETDQRRGGGVGVKINAAAALFKKHRLLYGASITVSGDNFSVVTDESFIETLYARGCRLFFFIEYLPATPGSETLVLDEVQKSELQSFIKMLRQRCRAIFFDFPGDEYELGPCLSAGRGFIHISAEGDVEPCPFSPYSDSNLRTNSLQECLASKFFDRIRSMPPEMEDAGGNCALFANREWVAEQAGSVTK